MRTEAILYVPSDTPEAMTMATRKVAGVPMIVRGVMTLAGAGIEKCVLLVAKTQRPEIERFLTKYKEKDLPQITIIQYEEPYGVGPDIITKVGRKIGDRCLMINANLIFEKELVEDIRNHRMDNGDMIICREGAHPLPVYDISKYVWMTLEAFTTLRPRSIESCLRHMIEASRTSVVQKRTALNTFLVTHDRDRAVAEKSLAEAIRHRIGGPIAKFINKRISLPISLILSKLWISPNTITAVNIVIGVFSGVFVADGHRYEVILFGAILFQIASIVDGCDGEVAKFTFRCSKFGQYADTLCDNLSLASFLIGIIAGYWRNTHSATAFIVGGILVFTALITFFWMIRYLKKHTESASLVTFDTQYLQKLEKQPSWLLTFIKYGKYTLKKDVFSFMFLMFAIFGVLYSWLFIAAIGTTTAAIILTYLNVQEMLASSRKKKVMRSDLQSEGQSI
ncbi:MAG: hypothetical protein HN337_02130 [Deltaproteobacteria bacterium]|jgi:phosphatidylglycerophosphate synthase|nr:hypothetical protein [Deltaproteobacteria bacterium]